MDRIPSWCKLAAGSVALSTAFELLYYLLNKKRRSDDGDIDVAFFPDKALPCDAYFSYGCTKANCWLSHEETSSMKVLQFLSRAEVTLDVCVYCIASSELIDAVLACQERGVVVRVITDQAQALEQPLQIGRLREKGVDVRTNNNTFFMHHKFVVRDGRHLMTGSFNWSKNAMLGNHENLVFLSKKHIVARYQEAFNKLWTEFQLGS